MATKLSDAKIHELSLVFAKKDGKEWSPRNGEALVFGTKAGEADKRGFLGELIEKLKSWYTDGPIVNSDGNSNGTGTDYNACVTLIQQMYYDLQSAIYISEDTARGAAVTAILDKFLGQLDEIRGSVADTDDTGKAGARHSAADQAKIDAAAKSMGNLKKHLDAASKAHSAASDSINGLKPQSKDDGASGSGEDDSTNDGTDKAAVDAGTGATNNTNDAAETVGAGTSESKAAPAEGETEMTKEEIAALVADTVKAAVAEAVKSTTEAVQAQSQTEIDAAKALADEATQKAADAETARLTAEAAQKAAEALTNANARKGSGAAAETPAVEAQKARSESLQRTIKAVNSGSGISPI